MIKLTRAKSPEELTDEYIRINTEAYKAATEKPSPWNTDWMKKRLLESSYGKCAYCECKLNEESKYVEVEHFRDKKHFPDAILIWENLLPSCKRCNGNKSAHNVDTEGMIVNPYDFNPKDHLYLESCRLKGKDEIGKMTVEIVYLNESQKLVMPRFECQEAIEKAIDGLLERLEKYLENRITRRRNKLVGTLKDLLIMCQPEEEYAATCATVLHRSLEFQTVVNEVKKEGLWTSELQSLFDRSLDICLFKP